MVLCKLGVYFLMVIYKRTHFVSLTLPNHQPQDTKCSYIGTLLIKGFTSQITVTLLFFLYYYGYIDERKLVNNYYLVFKKTFLLTLSLPTAK